MLKKEYEIIWEIIKKPWKKFTFKEVKKLSGKKSESYIYNSLKKFVKQRILREEKIGNIILYLLNLDSLKTQNYAGFILEFLSWQRKNIPFEDIEGIASKIPTDFFILIITGSYADNTQRKDSDIDLVIICDDTFEPQKIYSELKHECEMNIPKIHLYIFKRKEFLDMLLDKKANYGKEIIKNNIIFFGGEEYYKIVSEAMKNGFAG
jgi:DNA polymerase sigma